MYLYQTPSCFSSMFASHLFIHFVATIRQVVRVTTNLGGGKRWGNLKLKILLINLIFPSVVLDSTHILWILKQKTSQDFVGAKDSPKDKGVVAFLDLIREDHGAYFSYFSFMCPHVSCYFDCEHLPAAGSVLIATSPGGRGDELPRAHWYTCQSFSIYLLSTGLMTEILKNTIQDKSPACKTSRSHFREKNTYEIQITLDQKK